jgi:signal transduction histidine kinase
VTHQICRLEVEDNGIGITMEDQQRLFKPFAQLHGSEVYEGVGLGLATVRKVMELMGGRCGVMSAPGQGSIFWLEVRVAV